MIETWEQFDTRRLSNLAKRITECKDDILCAELQRNYDVLKACTRSVPTNPATYKQLGDNL
jgi:hypothetical protein